MPTTLIEDDLRQFTGTEQYHRHWGMRSIQYTDGVKFVADQGGAYWLVDKIATLQMERNIAAEPFQVWRLDRSADNSAVLTCDDGDKLGVAGSEPIVLHREAISFTDFPLDKIELWVEHGVILLPSEH